ncbi:hypothetical protein BGX27_002550, partial [Mortierella sp. AM989]
MNKEWRSAERIQAEDSFFDEEGAIMNLERARRRVHEDVDNVLSKRQRAKYRNEEAELDNILESTSKRTEFVRNFIRISIWIRIRFECAQTPCKTYGFEWGSIRSATSNLESEYRQDEERESEPGGAVGDTQEDLLTTQDQESSGLESEYCQDEERESESGGTVDDTQEDLLTTQDLSNILENIVRSQHPHCEWKVENSCVACLFQEYQKICAQALEDKTLRKAEIADAIMRAVFKQKILDELVKPVALPELEIDDGAIAKAVRLRINNMPEDACETLRSLNRKTRLMFEGLLEMLPEEVDRTVSEITFTTNYVAPLLNHILKVDGKASVHYPNTDSKVQKRQGLKPDRPDITVKAQDHEILFGEITGPCQVNNDAKNKWDLFRLARFGKAFLDKGNGFVPLLQVVHQSGSMMRLQAKVRVMYFLERVGRLTIPCTLSTVPTLLATLPTFVAAK